MAGDLFFRLRKGDEVYVLSEGDMLIGRDVACQIRMDEDLVSRRHARLRLDEDGLLFEDLGSANGSRVNEVRVEGPVRLKDGDRVRIGVSVLEVEQVLAEAVATPTLRLVICPSCAAVVDRSMNFCVECGYHMDGEIKEQRCERCGTNVPVGEAFCPGCGARLRPATPSAGRERSRS